MPSLRTHYWRISYASDKHNPVADFYIPALECAIHYDRKSGYFNSTILSKVARGLGAMLHKQGRIRLLMGCQFSPQDLKAIQQGYQLRDALTQTLDTHLIPPTTFAQLKHFEILSWLIQHGILDIRIAIPLTRTGIPSLDPHHLFHEKVGIFTDSQGDQLAFSGSNNETTSGWETNIESFHVFCAWEGGRDLERVQEEIQRFQQLWDNHVPHVSVFEIPAAIQQKLLRYAPTTAPTWDPQDEHDFRPLLSPHQGEPLPPPQPTPEPQLHRDPRIGERDRQAFLALAHIHEHPGSLDYCLQTIPVDPWPHQMKILRRMVAQFPRNALIADEVGLGKTIETGLTLRYLLVTRKVQRVLILSPASVQPQWQDELREKFNLHFWSFTQGVLRDPFHQNIPTTQNLWNTKDLILASSHLVRRQDRMHELLAADPWDLVILDEAHHARRQSPQARKETPNRLLSLMRQLRETGKAQSLLLLSATPMQIDTVEIFDLLSLLGLHGDWSYSDAFCDYFATLTAPPNAGILTFWQDMATNYFRHGGQPCPRFQSYVERTQKLAAYRLQDLWQQGQPIVNPRHILEDEPFLTLSRQFLTINTPLKDLMFRHTRDTLRHYYRRGLLERDVPTREVADLAIILEPERETPLYEAVSTYVRHFYNLAQKDNRKALGFLMTLYRKRLTSSFYAIQQSLSRRLDALLTQQGSGLTDDDLNDLDDADDAVIAGLESYLESVDPREIDHLQDLLRQFDNTGEDTKFSQFLTLIRQELSQRESLIVFTQYTDTMDYLRQVLLPLYGSLIACYSGRGGESNINGEWQSVPKETIKHQFRQGSIKILLCTESASEGLNLQTCGVLINYDLPWNPMRVEQRIGRIDRIGQYYATVRIHNLYYDGTVEAKVYRKLRDRINAFANVVGNLQPILAKVPTFIEKAVMSADPTEEDVLFSQFQQELEIPPLRPSLDDMVASDIDADLKELATGIPPTPFSPNELEQLFTTSPLLKHLGYHFTPKAPGTWIMSCPPHEIEATFDPRIFDLHPSLHLLNHGDPWFESMLAAILSS
jgi:ERCC4-related helicase